MKVIIILFLGIFLFGCLAEEPINQPFHTFTPLDVGDGTRISSPQAQGIDTTALSQVFNQVLTDERFWSIRSLLVYKNSYLIGEHYFKDDSDIDRLQLVWSCTKQVLGILIGTLVDRGLIESLDDQLGKYLSIAQDYPSKSKITIRQLLTMQSGIGYHNDKHTDLFLQKKVNNSLEMVLNLPDVDKPGTHFNYNDGNAHLLSALIHDVTGVPTDQWANEILFEPLGIKNYRWTRYIDGTTLGAFGLELTPRDLGKIGLCVQRNGTYESQKIISTDWIQIMTTAQVTSPADFDFGFLWWVHPERDIHFMWGHGGQYAIVSPQEQLTIVLTALPFTEGEFEIPIDEALKLFDKIVEH